MEEGRGNRGLGRDMKLEHLLGRGEEYWEKPLSCSRQVMADNDTVPSSFLKNVKVGLQHYHLLSYIYIIITHLHSKFIFTLICTIFSIS